MIFLNCVVKIQHLIANLKIILIHQSLDLAHQRLSDKVIDKLAKMKFENSSFT